MIGILTFHEVFNPGAFLQALATQRLVESLGHEAKIIDYTPPAHRYSLRRSMTASSWSLPFRIRYLTSEYLKDRAFEESRRRLMNLTERYDSIDEMTEEFDCVLVGADVVWNFTIERYGKDPVYFGHGLKTRKLVSFAASFGPCSIDDIPPDYVKTGLSKFDAISVRDLNSSGMVESIAGRSAVVICDPAFHLDLSRLPLESCEREPFLLVYMLRPYLSSQTIAQIKDFARKHHLKIVATMYPQKNWVDKNRTTEGPMEWLSLMQGARYVVTNTFHGMVFCAKMEKRFALQYTPSIKSKAKDTVEILGLESRLAEDARSIEDVLSDNHSFDHARQKIAALTRDARRFLEHQL